MSLINTMLNVRIAIELKGDPYRVLRIAKNSESLGSPLRRQYKTLLKQDINYFIRATDIFLDNNI